VLTPAVLTRAAALGGGLVLLAAGPAWAHVEVEASPARALAANATLTVHGEAERDGTGVDGVRIQLPAGLVPADFRLLRGPAGWKTGGTGQVLTAAGPALPAGRDLDLSFRVRQLPAGSQLVLKTVQSYADGSADSWIEVPTAAVPDPDNPAPVVALQAAAPGATPIPRATAPAPTTSAPTTPAAPTTTVPPVPEPTTGTTAAAPAPAEDGDTGSLVGWLFGGVAIGLLLLGLVVLAARRRGIPRA
jgi:uncharacterized protein YcnI